jgi:hypothetical protein
MISDQLGRTKDSTPVLGLSTVEEAWLRGQDKKGTGYKKWVGRIPT